MSKVRLAGNRDNVSEWSRIMCLAGNQDNVSRVERCFSEVAL